MSGDIYVCHHWVGGVTGSESAEAGTRPTAARARDVPTAKKYPAPKSAVGGASAALAQGHLLGGAVGPQRTTGQSRGPPHSSCSLLRSRQHPRWGSKEIVVSCPQRWERRWRSTDRSSESRRQPPRQAPPGLKVWAGGKRGRCPHTEDSGGPGRQPPPPHGGPPGAASPQALPLIPGRPHPPPKLTAPQKCAHTAHLQQMVSRTQRRHRHLLHTLPTTPRDPGPSVGQSINKHLLGPSGFPVHRASTAQDALSPSGQCPGDRREDSLSAAGARCARLGAWNSMGKVPGRNNQASAVRGVWREAEGRGEEGRGTAAGREARGPGGARRCRKGA